MEAHLELVQEGVSVTGPTIEVTLGPYRDEEGGAVQLQTTGGAPGSHHGNVGGGRRRGPRESGSDVSGVGPQMGESGWPVRYAGGGPGGMVAGGLKREELSEGLVTVAGKTRLEDV